MSFHAGVVFGLDKDLSFKSVLGRCDIEARTNTKKKQFPWNLEKIIFFMADDPHSSHKIHLIYNRQFW